MQEKTTLNGHEDQRMAAIPVIQDWCHRPVVLHTLLYPVLRPDVAAHQYISKGRALGCALRTGQDLPV